MDFVGFSNHRPDSEIGRDSVSETGFRISSIAMEDTTPTFDQSLIRAIFKHIWTRKSQEREKNRGGDGVSDEVIPGTSKKNRPTSANGNAMKLSSELLRIFVTEAVQRAAAIAEAEGIAEIEATHLERILPQLLLDF